MAHFIETESVEQAGGPGEKVVWEAMKQVFRNEDCLGYWHYPIFMGQGKTRKEPDILMVDRELGVLIVEVKSLTIHNIVSIQGHRWEMQNFYAAHIQPYQQAENQLYAILGWCDQEPLIRRQVTGRVLVALPQVSREEWEWRGFHQLPSQPPILFREDLRQVVTLYDKIAATAPVVHGQTLTANQWQALQVVIGGTAVLKKDSPGDSPQPTTRRAIIDTVREQLVKFDLQQERIGKQIPPGIQRIRGIAGSGKTVLLAQRAVHMHLKHPEWCIALVFFTRSLYDQILGLVDKWLRHFTEGEQSYHPDNPNLKVYHAWGAKEQPGLYRDICLAHQVRPLTANDIKGMNLNPNDSLIYLCQQLLGQVATFQPMFDALLIDEGQDLVTDNAALLFEQKQPFYWLAYQALRPHGEDVRQRRLYWAYDEAQSLSSLAIPQYKTLFGEELGQKLAQGVSYKGGMQKSEVMASCYRTPSPILTAAHALGMGLLRSEGMLSVGLSTKQDWEQLGYQVMAGEFFEGRRVVLQRPVAHSPNPVPEYWSEYVLQFRAYESRMKEMEALARNISQNIKQEQLKPCREILVIVLGSKFEIGKFTQFVAQSLQQQGIDVFYPTATRLNEPPHYPDNKDPNRFWHEGGVTISDIHRAKGNEADMVYVVGADKVAQAEGEVNLRNQLFVALTRSKGWVRLSGVDQQYALFNEIKRVIACGDTFEFTFRRAKQPDSPADETAFVGRLL